MTQREIIRNNLNKSDWEITKDKCDSTRAHRRHLAADGKHENKRKTYCTNVNLRIIEILITLMYNLTAVTAAVTADVSAGPGLHNRSEEGYSVPQYGLHHALSVNGLPARHNLSKYTQRIRNHQGMMVGLAAGSVKKVHIDQCIHHVWNTQRFYESLAARAIPFARQTLATSVVQLLNHLPQTLFRNLCVQGPLERVQPLFW